MFVCTANIDDYFHSSASEQIALTELLQPEMNAEYRTLLVCIRLSGIMQ